MKLRKTHDRHIGHMHVPNLPVACLVNLLSVGRDPFAVACTCIVGESLYGYKAWLAVCGLNLKLDLSAGHLYQALFQRDVLVQASSIDRQQEVTFPNVCSGSRQW